MRANTGLKRLLVLVAVAAVILAMALPALAQAPAAGTKIGNQASATYTDASLIQRTSTSSTVYTVVQMVPSVSLTAPGAKTATPGAQVTYPHTLTNTGNGQDTFKITTAESGTFTHTGVYVYADANGDGIPDNNIDLTNQVITVQPGAANAFKFVVVGTVPTSATSTQTGTITVTATSQSTGNPASANADLTTVTGNAVMNITKSISQNYGLPGSGPFSVTFNYTNQGNATATNVTITDILPAGMTYQAGSGLWSVTGATALTDATGDKQPSSGSPNIDYSVTGNTVTAKIDQVAPGTSGTISFSVKIAAGATVGVLQNTATTSFNDGTGTTVNGNTNTVNFNVQQQAAVTISDTGANGDTDGVNGIQHIASVAQGGTVSFYNTVTNTGTGTDTFDITVAPGTFPAGTTFLLYQSDGTTPLVQDSNNDGIPDITLAANSSYTLVVKAVLPPSASGTNGGAGYTATATAKSTVSGAYIVNPGASANVTEKLDQITANAVDVTNNAPIGGSSPLGVGAGPEASPVVTNTSNPGTGTTFTLYVNNTGNQADTYDLSVTTALPTGWTVTFRSATTDCTAANLGGPLSNTGTINGPSNKLVCAVVSIPNNYAAGNVDINFQAKSPTSGVLDQIHDRVTVNNYPLITLTPPQVSTVYASGTVIYKHTLSNGGNTTENVTLSTTDTQSASGWGSVFYDDSGSVPGSFDGTDKQITAPVNLAPGASVVVYIKVTAPAGAAIGTVDSSTGSGVYSAGTATVKDDSTVIAGDLRLTKEQYVDAGCTGSAPTWTQTNVNANPGQCVQYRITATNQGSANVTTVAISDATPAFTTYFATPAASCTAPLACPVVTPTAGTAGTVSASTATLKPGESAILIFAVQIAH